MHSYLGAALLLAQHAHPAHSPQFYADGWPPLIAVALLLAILATSAVQRTRKQRAAERALRLRIANPGYYDGEQGQYVQGPRV